MDNEKGTMMIAREWKATCPKQHEQGFIEYLYQTGVKETSETDGFLGAQIFNRELNGEVEITLLTYWKDLECIKAFAGEDIGVAKLYPEDEKYQLNPDRHVNHYQVHENLWA
jgi:heme-degrading monooxygenase HmoA